MIGAVWRPTRREAYPVLGIQGYIGDYAVSVVDLPATGPQLITIPIEDIRISPDRSIVRSLTASFHDHSRIDRCRCASTRGSGFSQAQAVAQAGAGGTASATNFPQN
ncbi:hypothetical protein SEA_BOSNIA_48 [Gordonia phage Bosnia]|uniref:DUF7323 domain-containing protein n=1 Tax=Gordonia phage Bosnia TaxID=2776839 RepID=A0A7L8ZD85_9CAUD|nr:hypothetical protein PP486_gp48 [Gordonia phage Bosnia]QOI66878.1 hypothetical protein SEA_BOSNIA_48 [Gordonia phage Bosnia]